MNYREACDWLSQHQFFKIKLGLETTSALLHEFGDPQKKLAIIHIAGTNGKGSVGATLLSILSAGGYRAGFYSSPHLTSVRERFRIGSELIPRDTFTRLINYFDKQLAGRPHPTYFELTTLLTLLWFAEEKVDVAILETGMGGRLDATNVVTPLLSIITDISRDHEQYLGHTLEAIAGEKAGIIKPGVPVVFSGRAPEALPVITDRCKEMGSELLLFDRDFSGKPVDAGLCYTGLNGQPHTYPLALRGSHQIVNTSLALAALEKLSDRFPLDAAQIADGLKSVTWPGRMETILVTHKGRQLRVLFDGAHNEAGVHQLVESLTNGYPRKRLFLVWGNMADKVMGPEFAQIANLADTLLLTRAEQQRSDKPEHLLTMLPDNLQQIATCVEPPEEALTRAMDQATEEDLICVAGSLYLVGRIRGALLKETYDG